MRLYIKIKNFKFSLLGTKIEVCKYIFIYFNIIYKLQSWSPKVKFLYFLSFCHDHINGYIEYEIR